MAKLILQAILLVTLVSALYGAPQNPTTPRNHAVPAIATLSNEKSSEHSSSSEEAKIRPARTPDHDGTNHDHKDEHHGAVKLDEHIDHGSSTTPKTRPARSAEGDEKKHEDEHHAPATLTQKQEEHKHEATTSTKPRAARAAEEPKKHDESHEEAHPTQDNKKEAPSKPRTTRDAEKNEKHEDSHEHSHHASSSTKDSQEHKHEATTGAAARPARATEEEKKGAVHDQPIPIPPTLKEENKNQETKHTEEKGETPKHKRETHEKEHDDSSEESHEDNEHKSESPLSYAKQLSEQKGDAHFALPNQDSEYERHVRQTNDHHSHIQNDGPPVNSHLLDHGKPNDSSSSSSSSSEENKSKSS